MSTTRLPELPAINPKDSLPYDLIRYVSGYPKSYVQQYAEDYGRATWKAAMKKAADELCQQAADIKEANTYRGRVSNAAAFTADQMELMASVLLALPLPELAGSPQERREG